MAAKQHASSNGGTSTVKLPEQPLQPLNASAKESVIESPQLSMTERRQAGHVAEGAGRRVSPFYVGPTGDPWPECLWDC